MTEMLSKCHWILEEPRERFLILHETESTSPAQV
jgi:hypothetical protein